MAKLTSGQAAHAVLCNLEHEQLTLKLIATDSTGDDSSKLVQLSGSSCGTGSSSRLNTEVGAALSSASNS